MAKEECNICNAFGSAGIQRKDVGLLAAAYIGHRDCVETFIKEGANVNCSDGTFNTDCRKNIDALLGYTSGSTFEDPFAGVGCTPLFYAAIRGHIDVIECLIRKGADVNLTKFQTTALSVAAANGQYGSVKCLIEAGADGNVFHELAEPALISATITTRFQML